MANNIFWEDAATGERRRTNVDMNVVGPDFFRTMGIRLVRGRAFTWDDRDGAPGVTVINEALARRLWPGADPIGRRMWSGNPRGADVPLEVVGVVADGRYYRGWRRADQPFMFLPSGQTYFPTMALVVRGRPGAVPTLADVRREVRALEPRALVVRLQTVRAAMADAIALERMGTKLLSLFGLLALTLAAVGVYGVVSFAATERTREMGVRMALGAARGEILRLMLARSLRSVVVGIAVGVAAALALARLIASLLFGVGPADPVTFAAVAAALVAVGLLASYIPARRATRVDPVAALRAE
jgi:putative ABC transport system permease protein